MTFIICLFFLWLRMFWVQCKYFINCSSSNICLIYILSLDCDYMPLGEGHRSTVQFHIISIASMHVINTYGKYYYRKRCIAISLFKIFPLVSDTLCYHSCHCMKQLWKSSFLNVFSRITVMIISISWSIQNVNFHTHFNAGKQPNIQWCKKH